MVFRTQKDVWCTFGARCERAPNFFSPAYEKEKKAQLFDIPKSRHQCKITWKTLPNENWGKSIEDVSGHASLHGCPPRKGVPYLKKFSEFK